MMDRVLITGATGGLGRALTLAFAGRHSELALHYRSAAAAAAELVAAAAELGSRAVALPQDLAVEDIDAAAQRLIASAHNELGGPVNLAVLNAADQSVQPWSELTAADWDAMYRATFRANAVLLKALGEQMRGLAAPNRVIVVIGSIEGYRPAAGHAPYSTMKAALHHLVAAAAHELGPAGVRVVGVAPGLIDRPGLVDGWPDGYHRWLETAALGRPVTAEEVAQVVRMLAGPAASGVTGVTVPVDAGWSAHPGW